MNIFWESKDGAFALTKLGIFASIAVILAAVLLIGLLKNKKTYSVRQVVFSAMSIALAFLLSMVKILRLSWGGSVTLLSMLFVTLTGYWYGPGVGFTAAFAYSMLQFVEGGGGYMLSLLQVALDYLLAFTALGASGFFRKQKNGLVTGYLVAVLLRGLFHAIGGYLFWMDYMPDNFPKELAFAYPVIYNYAYLLIEAAITIAVISLPPVKKALAQIKNMASAK